MSKKEIKKEEVEEVKRETKSNTETISGIEVGDPQELRPKELPLVVKPAKGGEWENEAQEEFAKVLNGYAYSNPTKWATKKDTLIKQLIDLGKNPENIVLLRGNKGNLSYKNKLIEQ